MLILVPIAAIIPYVAILNSTLWISIVILMIISLPIGVTLGLFALELKVRFFGKLKYKYALEEIHGEFKIAKWIIIFVIELAILIIVIAIGSVLLLLNLTQFFIYVLIGEVCVLVLAIIIFNRMFPKK